GRAAIQVSAEAPRIREVVVVEGHVARAITRLGRAEEAEERAGSAHRDVVIELDRPLPREDLEAAVLVEPEVVEPMERAEGEDVVMDVRAFAEVLDLKRLAPGSDDPVVVDLEVGKQMRRRISGPAEVEALGVDVVDVRVVDANVRHRFGRVGLSTIPRVD